MSISDFQILSKLGEGAYSSVYKVKRITDGQIYALKKVRMVNLSEKEKENSINEVRILASIHNPNIISYHEAFIDESSQSLCIVMEFANNGDLFQKICKHQKEGAYIEEHEIWSIFIQSVRGLRALHDLEIMHRDMKSANVFLTVDGKAKLGDLNVSKIAKKGLNYTQTGTPYYASPEVWKDQPYDIKSDIWSLGCVLYEMITLRPPFRAEDMAGLFKKVLKGIYPKIPPKYSMELALLVKSLLQVSPTLRPNCDKILKLPAVQRWISKLFPNDTFDDPEQNVLLQTIRVTKNLMFLTDKLPKPIYDDEQNKRNTSDFAKVNNGTEYTNNTTTDTTEIKLRPRKKVRMVKIEEADEEKERDVKKIRKKVILEKSDNSLPEMKIKVDEQIPLISGAKKYSKPKNVSMDKIKDQEVALINMNMPPMIAQMLLRKQKEMLLKQLLINPSKIPSKVLGSPYISRLNKKIISKKVKYRDNPALQKAIESVGRSIKGNGMISALQ